MSSVMCTMECTLDFLTDTLAHLAKKEVPDNTSRNMIVATLYALTNIMYRKHMYHEVFFELQGKLAQCPPVPPPPHKHTHTFPSTRSLTSHS